MSPNLAKSLQSFLRQWYLRMIEHHVPCHVPSFKTIFIKHASVVDILCNHKSAIESWSLDKHPRCCCDTWSQYKSAALNPNSDHWVLSGSLLTNFLPDDVAVLAEGSLQNKVFPQQREFSYLLQRGIFQWCKFNGLPSIPKSMILDLSSTLWSSHTSHLTNHITRSSIKKLEQVFPGAVFHCEDKHSSSLRIFCPGLHHQAIEKTFLDPEVFAPVNDTPQNITSALVDQLLRQYGPSYPWAAGKGRQLPSGYILAKKKKDFTSGRPIISFVDAPFRPMLNILARMIFQLIPIACPDHFATGDVYHLLSVLRQAPEHGILQLYNQDLAGFFTSIDQPRFIGAWHMLLDLLRPHMDVSDNEVFSVYPGRFNNPGDLIKGRTFRRLNVTRKILIKDIPSLMTTALNMQTFCLGRRCVSQLRGSPMGSPLAPALCLMVVSISEQIWAANFKSILNNHHLFVRHIRYVDNRLILGDPHIQSLPPYEVLLNDGFYGKPIVLETEPDQEFLGFMLETNPFELIFFGPTNVSQVLSPFPASPPKVLLSGFRSRCHIVVKGAFPAHRVHQGLEQSIQLYSLAGLDRDEPNCISSQILNAQTAPRKKSQRTFHSLGFLGFLSVC